MEQTVVQQPVVNATPPAATTPPAQPVPVTTDITGVTTPPAGGTEPPPSTEQPRETPEAIPYDRFKEVVDARNVMNEEVRNLKAQIQVMEQFAKQPTSGQPAVNPTQVQPESMLESAFKSFGDEPYLNRDQVKDVLTQMDQSFRNEIAGLVFMIRNPDFNQVISNDPNSPLVQALNSNPELVQVIKSSPNPTLAAYQIGKTFARNKQPVNPTPPPPPPPPSTTPSVPTLGALGGRGALGGKPNWNTMTDAEFAENQRKLGIQPAI